MVIFWVEKNDCGRSRLVDSRAMPGRDKFKISKMDMFFFGKMTSCMLSGISG